MSRGLRLLLATDAVGGVWQYSVELARALAPLGVEAMLAVMGSSPAAGRRAAAKGLTLIETGLPLEWLAEGPTAIGRAGRALAALARREGADLVQTASAALLAEADFDMPVVAVQHSCAATWWKAVRGTALPPHFAWLTDLVRKGLHAADIVVAPSATFAAATAGYYGLKRVVPVHNGRTPPAAARRAAPDDSIFTAGRLWDEGKDLATLDAAAARLPVPVYAAGPARGPNGAAVRFAAVYPLGELHDEEVATRLLKRPIFVSTALYEPFGLAVLEAAAAGCPLVLTDIPTFRELWDGAALFVPPRDPAGFASALGDLVGDGLRREALGSAARQRAGRFTPARMAAGMAAIYSGLGSRRTVSLRSLAAPDLAGAA